MVAAFHGGLNLDAVRATMQRSLLEAAYGRAIPELDEVGWEELGAGMEAITGLNRDKVNEEARRFYYTDPVARHLVELHSAYTFGRGVTLRSKDNDTDEWIQQFWNNPRNRASISRVRQQWRLSRELQLDGEVFLAFYTSTLTGKVTVRCIPAGQIVHIEYHPGDAGMPLWFKRVYRDSAGEKIVQIIPDYRVADLKGAMRYLEGAQNTEIAMMHILGNDMDGRGLSELTTSIPWIKALKGFMEDRATLSLALATFAFRMQIKGNRQAAARIASQWGDYETSLRYGSSSADGRERRQGANTFIANEAVDLEQLKTDSGAANAYTDGRMLKQQIGIGKGIFEHYLGDPSTGNLATATAMELPMLKLFEFGQEDWGDHFEEIGEFVVRQGIRFGALRNGIASVDMSGGVPLWEVIPNTGAELSVEAIFPPVIQRDIAVWASALAQITQSESMAGHSILPPEEKVKNVLRMFGYTGNVGEIIEKMQADGSLDVQRPEQPQPQPPANQENQQEADALIKHSSINEADPPEDDEKKKKLVEVGEPLSDEESKAAAAVSVEDFKQAFKDFKNWPTLEELAEELGFDSVEDLDDA